MDNAIFIEGLIYTVRYEFLYCLWLANNQPQTVTTVGQGPLNMMRTQLEFIDINDCV